MITLNVDMDGVVADFENYWDSRLKELGYTGGIDAEDKDRQVYRNEIRTVGIFQNLQPLPSAQKLINFLNFYRARGVTVHFLTASGVSDLDIVEIVRGQKENWLREVLKTDIPAIVVGAKREKQQYVKTVSDVIIDDNQGTITNWNKNGGTALLYTEDTAEETLLELAKCLENLIDMENIE